MFGRPLALIGDITYRDETNTEFRTDSPFNIQLDSFTLRQTSRGVLIHWRTSIEIDTVAFSVLRAEWAPSSRVDTGTVVLRVVTEQPLPARGNALGGAEYEFLDRSPMTPGRPLHYYLEDIDLFGRTTRHGPAAVRTKPQTTDGRSGRR